LGHDWLAHQQRGSPDSDSCNVAEVDHSLCAIITMTRYRRLASLALLLFSSYGTRNIVHCDYSILISQVTSSFVVGEGVDKVDPYCSTVYPKCSL
jgi:hypothetical protein